MSGGMGRELHFSDIRRLPGWARAPGKGGVRVRSLTSDLANTDRTPVPFSQRERQVCGIVSPDCVQPQGTILGGWPPFLSALDAAPDGAKGRLPILTRQHTKMERGRAAAVKTYWEAARRDISVATVSRPAGEQQTLRPGRTGTPRSWLLWVCCLRGSFWSIVLCRSSGRLCKSCVSSDVASAENVPLTSRYKAGVQPVVALWELSAGHPPPVAL